tara:strand:+ start:17874 stop:19739 length:1866 start_codon:yes stop_codon:yes gene_type:complete
MALNDAVPSSATDVFKRNAADADKLLNASGPVINRLGTPLASWEQITQSHAAWNNRGAWTTTTAYAVNDIWESAGVWYVVLSAYTSGASAATDIAGINVIALQSKTNNEFQGVSGATTAIIANPSLFPLNSAVSTSSYRTPAECTTLGITYPDGGGADYVVVTGGTGTADGGSFINVGSLQLALVQKEMLIDPRQFGAVVGTDSSSQVQAAANFGALTRRGLYFAAHPNSTNWLFSNIDISGPMEIRGAGTNSSVITPASSGHVFRIRGRQVTATQLGFLHDRSFACDVFKIDHILNDTNPPQAISKWFNFDTLFAQGFKGSAVKAINCVWETQFRHFHTRACGDVTGNSAVWDFTNPSSLDQTNNIEFFNCYTIFPNYYGYRFEAVTSKSFRKIKIYNGMMHGGTSDADVATVLPYPMISMTRVDDLDIFNNNITFATDDPAVNVIESTGEAGNLSLKIRIDGNQIECSGNTGTLISVDHTRDVHIAPNSLSEMASGTHVDITANCLESFIEEQLVTGSADLNISNSASGKVGLTSILNEYKQPYFLTNEFNAAGEQAITAATSVNVVFAIAEPLTTYSPLAIPNFNAGSVWITNKTTAGFTINCSISGSGVFFWHVKRP